MFWDRFKRKRNDEPELDPEPRDDAPHACAAQVRDTSLTVDDFINGFSEGVVVDVIDGLAYRALTDGPQSLSGIERYAVRLLSTLDTARLRALWAEHSPEMNRLNTTGLFWCGFPSHEMSHEDAAVLLHAESILNRLALIADRLSGASRHATGHREGSSSMRLASTSEEACSAADWAIIRGVADGAPVALRAVSSDNPSLSLFDVTGRRGGNWDVAVRLADACEALALPFRLEYRLLPSVEQGLVAMHVDLPSGAWFAGERWASGAWEDCAPRADDEAAAYCVRLVMLLAAVGFGSGVGIERVIIDAASRDGAGLHFQFDISRARFLCRAIPLIEGGRAGMPDAQEDLVSMLEVLSPDRWALIADADGSLIAASDDRAHRDIEDALRGIWCPLAEDERPLPESLRDLLFADVAADLDVFDPVEERVKNRFDCIIGDAVESPLLAIAQLEEMVSEFDKAMPGDGRAPLFCEGAFGRYALSLLQASSKIRYSRLPDFAMHARVMLFRLYQEVGDAEAALRQAEECQRLAPTSSLPYVMLLDAYEGLGRCEEAIEVAKVGLSACLLCEDADYLYYRLVGSFFQADRPDEALASLALVRPSSPWRSGIGEDGGAFASSMQREGGSPRSEQTGSLPSRSEAEARLRAFGVPIAPSRAAERLVAAAAIRLCDAGLFAAAAPVTSLLGRYVGSDALIALSSSMKLGVL